MKFSQLIIVQLFILMAIQPFTVFANGNEDDKNKEETKKETVDDSEELTTDLPKVSGLEVSGSIDAYYRGTVGADYDVAPGTSFANLPGFSLGMANLIISKEGSKAGFTADFVLGPRGEDATFLSPLLRPGGNSSIVNQLFAYYQVNEKLKFTLGNFNTFLGYEVISPTANFNYSTSYLFSYGPFSHTGLKADIEFENGLSLMAGIFNPTDATEFNSLNRYVGGLQLGYSFEKGSIYINGLFDDEFYQLDLTAGVDLSEKVYLGLNSSYADDLFFGAAIYAQFATSEKLSIGTRIEYFMDQGIGVVGMDEEIIDFTLSANYKIGDLTIIPEYRIDLASTAIYPNKEELEKNLSSFVLAVTYSF